MWVCASAGKPPSIERLLCQTSMADCSETWAALGRPQVPVIEAVRDAVDWFRANGYV